MSNKCYLCKAESVIVQVEEHFQIDEIEFSVPNMKFYECPKCGEQFADYELDKENSKKIKEAKNEVQI